MKIFLSSILILTFSCANMFSEFADKTTETAIIFEVEKEVSSGNWTPAITKAAELSAASLAIDRVRKLVASAYIGRCGMTFFSMMESLTDGADALFVTLMKAMPNSLAANVTDCVTGEGFLTAITEPDEGEKTMLAFSAMAKMGSILNRDADTDDDNTVDAAFDPCDSSDIDDTSMKQMVTGIAIFITNLNGLGSSVGQSQLGDLQSICSDLEAINPNFDFCTTTDVADVTADHISAARALLNEGQASMGLATCAASPASVANCTCP